MSGADDANEMFVEVQDTGPGLDPEKLDRLFQSFYTTKPDGIGMGLAISRSIAEAHGGRLSAAPNKPHGAVFRLTLPVEEKSSEGARNHRVCESSLFGNRIDHATFYPSTALKSSGSGKRSWI